MVGIIGVAVIFVIVYCLLRDKRISAAQNAAMSFLMQSFADLDKADIPLITCDTDGTLLHGDAHEIHPEVFRQILRLKNRHWILSCQRTAVSKSAEAVCSGG